MLELLYCKLFTQPDRKHLFLQSFLLPFLAFYQHGSIGTFVGNQIHLCTHNSYPVTFTCWGSCHFGSLYATPQTSNERFQSFHEIQYFQFVIIHCEVIIRHEREVKKHKIMVISTWTAYCSQLDLYTGWWLDFEMWELHCLVTSYEILLKKGNTLF